LWEGLPLVIIEAMSAGIPCICYNAGGLSEIINHPANGILIESKNKEKFAQKLVELCENSALRESTGKRAREDAQSFSMERCADRYIDLIKKIIDKQ
jgi:glycosyltransferase involved in cell wall biosynthesis